MLRMMQTMLLLRFTLFRLVLMRFRPIHVLSGLALSGLAVLAADRAQAASPIGNAGTAVVNEGAFSVEQRMGYLFDEENPREDNRFRMRQHVDYGFTDWYAIRIVAEQNKRQDESLDFTGVTFENRFQLFERRKHGWDGSLRLIYIFGAGGGEPDEVDIRLIANAPIGENWAFRHNTIIEHEIGDNAADGFLMEFRTQLMRNIPVEIDGVRRVSFGAEMFSDLGELEQPSRFNDQDHQIGPVMKASFNNGAYLQFGYRAGLSDDAPDHLLKLFVGKRF